MDYQNIYNNIINTRKQKTFNGYTEKHHIIPKSLGGGDNKDNLVELSAREHFICHLLLTKMYKEGTVEWIKMCKAFMNMFRHGNHKRYCPSKWYAYCREQFSQAQSLNQAGKGNSQYGKCWVIHSQTQQIKSINKLDLQEYVQQGWQQGRSLNPKYKNGKYVKLTEEQKASNKQQRQNKQQEKTYQVTNIKTGKRRFVTQEELQKLDSSWISLHYNIDEQKVKDMFVQGYKIQQIAQEFNMSYHNFYQWYRQRKQYIQQELTQVFGKTKICPVCGKEFPKYPKRKYCSKQCWQKDISK